MGWDRDARFEKAPRFKSVGPEKKDRNTWLEDDDSIAISTHLALAGAGVRKGCPGEGEGFNSCVGVLTSEGFLASSLF